MQTIFIKIISAVVILLMIWSCNSEKSKDLAIPHTKTKNTVAAKPIKKIPEKLIKGADSIDRKNTVPFLQAFGKENLETKVKLKTRFGNIVIQLYNETPLHRANFIFLSKVGYFDTTCFYRVVPDFIIQGGDSERPKTLRYRNRYSNYRVPAEFHPNLKHQYGAVAAARDWENNPSKESNPFEFYIVQNKQGAHHLDGEHTVFGQVISGFSVIDKIANLKAGSDEWPLNDVFIKVEVLD